jgi:outer membrane protein TolC
MLWLGAWVAAPSAAAAELSLARVLQQAEASLPPLVAAREDVAAADAFSLEVAGAFDPSWRTRASWTTLGYYRTGRIDSVVQQPTDLWGLSGFAGWRLGAGDFAVYDGKAETLSAGELRAGLSLPLLRDRAIDKRRAERAAGQLEPQVARAAQAQTRLELRRTAAVRYWNWVEAGQQLRIARHLHKMAVRRDADLGERVRLGDIAELDRLDHRRALLARQGQVVTAEQRLAVAAMELSLYLRDSQGQPQVPAESDLPPRMPEVPDALPSLPAAQTEAVAARPDIQRLATAARQQSVLTAQADNARLPALDLQAAVSRDLGNGAKNLTPFEMEVGLMLDVPVWNRTPTGKAAGARAKLAKIEAQAQWLRERVAVEVAQVHAELTAAVARLALARQELVQAKALADGERTAFAAGSSNVLVLNLREQAEAEAELRVVAAHLDWHRAWAGWQAVTARDPGI